MSDRLSLDYPAICDHFRTHLAFERTESRAFLTWFLETFYRLEDSDAQDAVCDGPDDKGVDGIYVDHNLERIDVLQSKLNQNPRKTLGDAALRSLYGTLSQFSSPSNAENLSSTTGNAELRGIIQSENVPELIRDGYVVRGVLVTNADLDANGRAYADSTNSLEIFDADRLHRSYVPSSTSAPVRATSTFDISGYDVIEHRTPDASAYIVPLLATQLVELDGLETGELFDWNVRQSLGRTKVNKAITQSIANPSEHKNFLLFHNGLTILCESLTHSDEELNIENYTVVNGCQSLTSLNENKKHLSDDLRILARIVQLPADSELANRITRHSNNQNSINARDLQSNSTIQRRLQTEFRRKFSGEYFYEIKRGEAQPSDSVITNAEAGRLLLAFDVQQPWACHQSYKVFDELHADIFGRPEVSAERIVALKVLSDAISSQLHKFRHSLLSGYRLTTYVLLYIGRKALETDDTGDTFCRYPADFVNTPDKRQRLQDAYSSVVADLIVDIDAEIDDIEKRDGFYDYKRQFKSVQAVRELERSVIPMYQKAVNRGRAQSFGDAWPEGG